MYQQLKNQFMQASLGTIIWVSLLTTLGNFAGVVSFNYFWRIIGIGMIFGFLFGVFYPLLWNHFNFSVPVNIFLSTLINLACQFAVVRLYAEAMYQVVAPYVLAIALVTLVLHILFFYFYKKNQNKKMAVELNSELG